MPFNIKNIFYNIPEVTYFYPKEFAMNVLIELRYYLLKKGFAMNGLYLGPYIRYKASEIYYGGTYDTQTLNYGMTVGFELYEKSGFTINALFCYGQGINLSTKITKEEFPKLRSQIIQRFTLDHVRLGVCIGYSF